MDKDARILIAGSHTLVGLALEQTLQRAGFHRCLMDVAAGLDLTDRNRVFAGLDSFRPEYVFLVAGKSGGIAANQRQPAELMLHNLLVETAVIDAAYRTGVRKLLYLASSCCYPRHCPQPMKPEYLMQGLLEPTNEAYAIAKLAGLKLCQAYRRQYGCRFIVGIPANPYGSGDDFDLENSHVIAALIRKMHEAKMTGQDCVTLWGTGRARRDFIFSRDLSEACLFVMARYEEETPLNMGSNQSITIAELAESIRTVVEFRGRIEYDSSKPDGMPVKCLDATPLYDLGWRPTYSLNAGVQETYRSFLSNTAISLRPAES